MKILLAVIVSALCFASVTAVTLEDFLGTEPLTRERIVRELLDYYMRDNPIGIPILKVPDPIIINDNATVGGMTFLGFEISGVSQFKLEYVNVNATSLKVAVLMRIPKIEALSVYNYPSYFGDVEDDCNITITGIDIKVNAEMGSDQQSELQLLSLKVEVIKESFLYTFENSPFGLNVLLATVDTALDTLLAGRIQDRVDVVTAKVNARLRERLGEKRFPIGIHPVDLLVAGLKEDLRHKMDPLTIGSKVVNLPVGITLNVSSINVTGLSTVHRAGEVSLQLIDDRLLLTLQLGSQAISVQTEVEISVPVLPSTTTSVEFTLDSFSVWVEVQQSADVRHPPQLRRIHITLGNFRLLSSGDSSLSYLLEAAVNGLPNALRGPITRAIEPLLHKRIQQRLHALDVEEIINRRLAAMENNEK